MTSARDEILRRIRRGLKDVPANEVADDVVVAREYRHAGESSSPELTLRFAERVREYKAHVEQVTEAELNGAISEACARRGVKRLVVPQDLPDAWVPAGVELVRDTALSYDQLDQTDGVLTGCAWGIAQTGTIVLDGGVAQGRRAISLVPDYHLCIVRVDQIVDLVPEAITKLAPAVREGRRPLTFISGPSATSDIELNRVEGVHGPRTLEVLIVG